MTKFIEKKIMDSLDNNKFTFDNLRCLNTINTTNTITNTSDAYILYYPSFISKDISFSLYDHLLLNAKWFRPKELLHGKEVLYPRQCASMYYEGDNNIKTYTPINFTKEVLEIKDFIEKFLIEEHILQKGRFRYCQMNYYSDGTQYMGLHRDRENANVKNIKDNIVDNNIAKNNIICTLSLGATRKLIFEELLKLRKGNKNPPRYMLNLNDGDLCIMSYGACGKNSNYKHGLPKDKNCKEGRIVITFRDWTF